jgi:hypothetical protein
MPIPTIAALGKVTLSISGITLVLQEWAPREAMHRVTDSRRYLGSRSVTGTLQSSKLFFPDSFEWTGTAILNENDYFVLQSIATLFRTSPDIPIVLKDENERLDSVNGALNGRSLVEGSDIVLSPSGIIIGYYEFNASLNLVEKDWAVRLGGQGSASAIYQCKIGFRERVNG